MCAKYYSGILLEQMLHPKNVAKNRTINHINFYLIFRNVHYLFIYILTFLFVQISMTQSYGTYNSYTGSYMLDNSSCRINISWCECVSMYAYDWITELIVYQDDERHPPIAKSCQLMYDWCVSACYLKRSAVSPTAIGVTSITRYTRSDLISKFQAAFHMVSCAIDLLTIIGHFFTLRAGYFCDNSTIEIATLLIKE